MAWPENQSSAMNEPLNQTTARWGLLEYWIAFWLLLGAIVGFVSSISMIVRSQDYQIWQINRGTEDLVIASFFAFVGIGFASVLVMQIRGMKWMS